MMKVILGIVLGVLLTLLVLFLFLTAGGMPVPTKGGPLPMERKIAKLALEHAIGKEEDRTPSFPIDESHLLSGVKIYRQHCAVCHGSLGQPPTAIAKGMFPKPPQLLPPKKGVTDDPIGETFWKVKNGIRLTGMPGYDESLTETEIWEVSALLAKANEMTPAVRAALGAR